MTAHTHTELVEGCYRCDLNRDEMADQLAEPDLEPEEEPLQDPTAIPADWVEGHDDNSASERGSHWEDE